MAGVLFTTLRAVLLLAFLLPACNGWACSETTGSTAELPRCALSQRAYMASVSRSSSPRILQ